jgi:DNA-binding NarL/FixJ family response regulator
MTAPHKREAMFCDIIPIEREDSNEMRIVLADDHNLIREGIRMLIDSEEGMEVVGEASDGPEVVKLAGELRPDLVILDLVMPEMSGVEAIRQIIAENESTKVLVLSGYRDRRFVMDAFRAGASGYLLKDCIRDELTTAIHTIMSGEPSLSKGILKLIMDEVRRCNPGKDGPFGALSARELETLRLIAEGKSTKHIAALFGVSVKTTESYRQQIMRKLGIGTVAGLVKFAIRGGLTDLE